MNPRRLIVMVMSAAIAVLGTTVVAEAEETLTPAIFWESDPVAPNETVVVVGENLGEDTQIVIRRIADDPSKPDAVRNDMGLRALRAGSQSLHFVVPAELSPGVFEYTITTVNGRVTRRLNIPRVFWLQGDQGRSATQGGWIRILGRNITRTAGAKVEVREEASGQSIEMTPSKASPWDLRVDIGHSFTPGLYRIRVWNGSGDSAAWSEWQTIEITSPAVDSQIIIDVKKLGAAGDGVKDDTAAIQRSLEMAKASGGATVFLPRGRYLVSGTLQIEPGTVLRGQSREAVVLAWTDFSAPPSSLIEGASDFTIADLTIVVGHHLHVISGGFGEINPKRTAGNIRIERVTVRASSFRGHITNVEVDRRFQAGQKFGSGGADTIRLQGQNLRIVECDIYGSGRSLFLSRPENSFVSGNRFSNGRWGWYSIVAPNGIIFENNEIVGGDLMSTGGGINTLSTDATIAQNVLFYRNTFSMFHGWDRESMTSDGPGGYYYGRIVAAGTKFLSLQSAMSNSSKLLPLQIGAGVLILGGKGRGQVSRISRLNGDVIELDRAWEIVPDETSVVLITKLLQKFLIVENIFTDAGVAVQFYGTSVDHVVVGNTSVRAGGFVNQGLFYNGYQPSWFIQFLRNEIKEGGLYEATPQNKTIVRETWLGSFGNQKEPNKAPLVLATVLRGNRLMGNAHIEVISSSTDSAAVADVLIENNAVRNADAGIVLRGGLSGMVMRGNVFENVLRPVIDQSRSLQ